MSEIHDRVLASLANGKRTVGDIRLYINRNYPGPRCSQARVSSALMDLASEKYVVQHHDGRWMVTDNRRKGSYARTG